LVGRLRLRFGGDVWDAEPELLVPAEPGVLVPAEPGLPVPSGRSCR